MVLYVKAIKKNFIWMYKKQISLPSPLETPRAIIIFIFSP